MTDIFLFAGTIEGKELAEAVCTDGLSVHAFTATEYGGSLLPDAAEAIRVTSGRLDKAQMLSLMREEMPRLVIDATHPYAAEASENIRKAAEEADISLLRLQRKESAAALPFGEPEAVRAGRPVSAAGRSVSAAGRDTADRSVVHVPSADAAAAFLAETDGNVLLTCGSKELAAFAAPDDFGDRLFARVLSTEEVVRSCAALGFSGKHLIAMQGPFSLEMNRALIRHTGAKWLVTKESGVQGGFPEKAAAAAEEGIGLIVIDRPAGVGPACGDADTEERDAGLTYRVCDSVGSCIKEVYRYFDIMPDRHFTLLGIGPGDAGGLTLDGLRALQEADVVLGASRMLGILKDLGLEDKPVFSSWKPSEMQRFVEENPQYRNIAAVLSGDPGFYSGAAKLTELWQDADVRVLPGLSTLQVLCAKVKTGWQHVYCVSRHGRAGNLLTALRTHEAVFLLPGETLPALCEKLIDGGFGTVRLAVGSRLSYADEQILAGTPEELKEMTAGEPYAVLIANPKAAHAVVTPGIPDAAFVRSRKTDAFGDTAEKTGVPLGSADGKCGVKPGETAAGKLRRTVPMTKEEVRAVSLAKLRLTRHAVVYDIGAGTGSVSVEAARIAYAGRVYAIETNPAAVELLYENRKSFGLDNMEIIEGMAPDAMADLPAPTHAFIGGSKGNLASIVAALRGKNPEVRIVINTVTVETETEARRVLENAASGNVSLPEASIPAEAHLQAGETPEVIHISVTREVQAGRYHMQRAENPIAVISFGGKQYE